jgi:hypothetical protein
VPTLPMLLIAIGGTILHPALPAITEALPRRGWRQPLPLQLEPLLTWYPPSPP